MFSRMKRIPFCSVREKRECEREGSSSSPCLSIEKKRDAVCSWCLMSLIFDWRRNKLPSSTDWSSLPHDERSFSFSCILFPSILFPFWSWNLLLQFLVCFFFRNTMNREQNRTEPIESNRGGRSNSYWVQSIEEDARNPNPTEYTWLCWKRRLDLGSDCCVSILLRNPSSPPVLHKCSSSPFTKRAVKEYPSAWKQRGCWSRIQAAANIPLFPPLWLHPHLLFHGNRSRKQRPPFSCSSWDSQLL